MDPIFGRVYSFSLFIFNWILVDPTGDSTKKSISKLSTQRAFMAADHYRNNPARSSCGLYLFGNKSWVLPIESNNKFSLTSGWRRA